MSSVLCRAHFYSELDTVIIVIMYISFQFSLKLFYVLKLVDIEQFLLHQSEKVLHHCIVETVSFTRHTLYDTMLSQDLLVHSMLVVPTSADQACLCMPNAADSA